VVAALALVVLPAHASAGGPVQIDVEPGGFDAFAPDDAESQVGDPGFSFVWEDPPTDDGHNVVSYDGLFTSGPPAVDPPGPYDVDPAAGTFDYFCVVHSSLMYGTLAVEPLLRANPDPSSGAFRAAWADNSSDVTGTYDVRYRVEDGPWSFWKTDTRKRKALFGEGSPAQLVPGQEYSISARTQKMSNPARRSRWSPPLVVTP
jgi:plastocyanin